MADTDTGKTSPIAANVVRAVEDLRADRNLSLRQLSERLTATGHPLITSAVHAIVQGRRRISVDDLVALARALGVSPASLLRGSAACESDPAYREACDLGERIGTAIADPDNWAKHRDEIIRGHRLLTAVLDDWLAKRDAETMLSNAWKFEPVQLTMRPPLFGPAKPLDPLDPYGVRGER